MEDVNCKEQHHEVVTWYLEYYCKMLCLDFLEVELDENGLDEIDAYFDVVRSIISILKPSNLQQPMCTDKLHLLLLLTEFCHRILKKEFHYPESSPFRNLADCVAYFYDKLLPNDSRKVYMIKAVNTQTVLRLCRMNKKRLALQLCKKLERKGAILHPKQLKIAIYCPKKLPSDLNYEQFLSDMQELVAAVLQTFENPFIQSVAAMISHYEIKLNKSEFLTGFGEYLKQNFNRKSPCIDATSTEQMYKRDTKLQSMPIFGSIECCQELSRSVTESCKDENLESLVGNSRGIDIVPDKENDLVEILPYHFKVQTASKICSLSTNSLSGHDKKQDESLGVIANAPSVSSPLTNGTSCIEKQELSSVLSNGKAVKNEVENKGALVSRHYEDELVDKPANSMTSNIGRNLTSDKEKLEQQHSRSVTTQNNSYDVFESSAEKTGKSSIVGCCNEMNSTNNNASIIQNEVDFQKITDSNECQKVEILKPCNTEEEVHNNTLKMEKTAVIRNVSNIIPIASMDTHEGASSRDFISKKPSSVAGNNKNKENYNYDNKNARKKRKYCDLFSNCSDGFIQLHQAKNRVCYTKIIADESSNKPEKFLIHNKKSSTGEWKSAKEKKRHSQNENKEKIREADSCNAQSNLSGSAGHVSVMLRGKEMQENGLESEGMSLQGDNLVTDSISAISGKWQTPNCIKFEPLDHNHSRSTGQKESNPIQSYLAIETSLINSTQNLEDSASKETKQGSNNLKSCSAVDFHSKQNFVEKFENNDTSLCSFDEAFQSTQPRYVRMRRNSSREQRTTNDQLNRSHTRWKRRSFTSDEEEWLKEGVRRFGIGKWAVILTMYPFHDRTSVNLKDKWRNLVKYDKK